MRIMMNKLKSIHFRNSGVEFEHRKEEAALVEPPRRHDPDDIEWVVSVLKDIASHCGQRGAGSVEVLIRRCALEVSYELERRTR